MANFWNDFTSRAALTEL